MTAAAVSCSRTDIVLRWGMEIVGENYIAPGHHRTLGRKNIIWHIRKVKITRRKMIIKFEWIEEGDGRYRVHFLTWMKRRYSTLRLPTIVIRTGSNQIRNGKFVANAAMMLSSMPDTAKAIPTTRIMKRNTVFRVNQNMT